MQEAQSEQNPTQLTKGGYDRLNLDGVFIKQKVNKWECLTGCEQGNTYYVYASDKEGNQKGKKLFKCKESSNLCAKCCMPPDFRPFKLKVQVEDDNQDVDGNDFLLLDRPCKCTFLCFNRPEISCTLVENGANKFVGTIKNPWSLCDAVLEVFDQDNNLKYVVNGSCCQLAFWCKAPCQSCQTVNFDIKTPSGETIANLQKRSPGCCTSLLTDADNFSVQFPSNATKEDKALLMATALFIDSRFFNESGANAFLNISRVSP